MGGAAVLFFPLAAADSRAHPFKIAPPFFGGCGKGLDFTADPVLVLLTAVR